MAGCRIAFVWHKPVSGMFVNKDVFSIVDRLSRRGYSVYLLVPGFNVDVDYSFNVVEVGEGKGRVRAILWGFRVFRFLRGISPHIVMFMHLYVGSVISGVLYKFSRFGRVFLYMKLDYSGEPPGSMLKRLFFMLKLYVVLLVFDLVSIETRCGYDRLLSWARIPSFLSRKIVVLPNGYNDFVFKASDSPRSRSIVVVSRVVRSKGIDLVVKALAMLGDRSRGWKIIVVGPIDDRDYYREVLEEARRLGVEVEFVGPRGPGEVMEYYSKASIFVLPSYNESFGLARVEAAAAGLPVVTTDTPCRDDLEGMGFIVVPVGDVGALARALGDLMSDWKLRKSVASRQLSRIKSWSEVVDELLSHIRARSKIGCDL